MDAQEDVWRRWGSAAEAADFQKGNIVLNEKGARWGLFLVTPFDRALKVLLHCHRGKQIVLSPLEEKKNTVLILGRLNLLNEIFHILYRFPVDLLNNVP